VLVVHATKKLRARLGIMPAHTSETSTTQLGDWYATAMFWRPQIALFVNEVTLVPVLVPLAPAATLGPRFATALADVLAVHGASSEFVAAEMEEMDQFCLAKTSNRSVIGIMNEFAFLAEVHRSDKPEPDFLDLSLRLAETPCGPLYKRHGSPDRELAALLAQTPFV
jgi:hypothetical protein